MESRLLEKFNSIIQSKEISFTEKEIFSLNSMYIDNERVEDYSSLEKGLDVALILLNEVNLGKIPVVSKLVYESVVSGLFPLEKVNDVFGIQVTSIVQGLLKANDLYKKSISVESENFRKLLLSLVEDIRVVIILICDQLYLMRNLNLFEEDEKMRIARESSYLYAPLAHRLGLYRVKSELEDLSLKQTNRTIYKEIATKLNETKRERDSYIDNFIGPLKSKLENAGFTFSIKGRTKSIYSIWNKIKKQNTTFENIYDLFAIRIILNTPIEKEKAECWQVYSIVTDMYQPNPKRLRDWLSIPKTNGYESLHTTVMGPQGKWVEVQIRTQRMDEIAEKGLAAHFKYKGIKSESSFDVWLANVRALLETPEADETAYMDDFKLNLYSKEVFVFTPKGELQQLPKGATILDFAFQIHSGLGCRCIGGKINGKSVSIRSVLNNGDQVEILTSSSQTPHKEWLSFVQTTKAKTRIKQFLREQEASNMELGKETLKRRLKNWKLDYDESVVSKLAKKCGYKTVQELYQDIAEERLDLSKVKEEYLACQEKDVVSTEEIRTVDKYEHTTDLEQISSQQDVLVIDEHLKGLEYSLAKCCNPIYGDDVFGFVSVHGGIKIHKSDCPNAPQMMSRFGYRFVKARWSGKSGSQYNCTLRVIGNDDIGIVTNITSVIQKEANVSLRSISVDSVDGLFQGHLTVMVNDTRELDNLIKKIKAIKGVKSVER